MSLRTAARPAKPIDNSNAELLASGAAGGGTPANALMDTNSTPSITRLRDSFEFFIVFVI